MKFVHLPRGNLLPSHQPGDLMYLFFSLILNALSIHLCCCFTLLLWSSSVRRRACLQLMVLQGQPGIILNTFFRRQKVACHSFLFGGNYCKAYTAHECRRRNNILMPGYYHYTSQHWCPHQIYNIGGRCQNHSPQANCNHPTHFKWPATCLKKHTFTVVRHVVFNQTSWLCSFSFLLVMAALLCSQHDGRIPEEPKNIDI